VRAKYNWVLILVTTVVVLLIFGNHGWEAVFSHIRHNGHEIMLKSGTVASTLILSLKCTVAIMPIFTFIIKLQPLAYFLARC